MGAGLPRETNGGRGRGASKREGSQLDGRRRGVAAAAVLLPLVARGSGADADAGGGDVLGIFFVLV